MDFFGGFGFLKTIREVESLTANNLIQVKLVDPEKFLNSIRHVSGDIRFAVIYDLKGNVILKQKMEGVVDHLTENENKIALKHTIESWNFRNSVSEKIGNAQYTLQVYDNLLRAIFPFGDRMLLVVTLQNTGRPHEIIGRINTILSGNPTRPKNFYGV